jgi:hypothetical protein
MGTDGAVGIASSYGLHGRRDGIRVPVGEDFSPLHVVQTSSGAHPASYKMSTGENSFSGVKRLGSDAEYSLPTSAEVKIYVDLYIHFPVRLHGVVLN